MYMYIHIYIYIHTYIYIYIYIYMYNASGDRGNPETERLSGKAKGGPSEGGFLNSLLFS